MRTAAPAGGLGQSFAPGTMLGKYELLATIGQGGMANVILARQRGPAGFEKVVVIKVVHPHMAQHKGAVSMLLDEARVAAQIDHPNVVHTHELGEAHGTFYIVMEYLAGESFNHVLRKHALASDSLDPMLGARIVADAAGGLHAAHELTDFEGKSLEIVHRDVSPGNILVLYNGNVKVLDFGIAKAQGRVTSTQDGELKGKYGYMSPEQIKNEPMDRRSDVFSLGVVLWEALATRRLFHTDNVAATLMQILNSPRVPPSHHVPTVPPALDAIALKALAVAPADRFQTCEEMKQAIEDAIWQSRCGTKEVEAHMKSLFTERIEQRRSLLSRAARDSFSDRDLELIGSVFKDQSATVPPRDIPTKVLDAAAPIPMAPKPGRRWLIVVAALVLIGGGGAAYVFATANADKHAQPENSQPPAPKPELASVSQPEIHVDANEPVAPPPDPVADPVPTEQPATDAKTDAKADAKHKTAHVTTKHTDLKQKPANPPTTADNSAELYQQATALYMKGDFIGAEADFKKAIAANKRYAPAYRGLGFLYQRSGDTTKALDALRTYLKLSPSAKDADAVKQRIEQMGG